MKTRTKAVILGSVAVGAIFVVGYIVYKNTKSA